MNTIYKTLILPGIVAAAIACNVDKENDILIIDPTSPQAVKISKVIDYSPAPGQFINSIPEYKDGMSKADMQSAALDLLNKGYSISLGSFGGYVVLELETPIDNREGEPDFMVGGNAIDNSAEPGVVYVSSDGSEWLMIKGECEASQCRSTTVTYRNGTEITWASSDGRTGTVRYLPQYNKQPYWPQWSAGELTFSGYELPSNSVLNTLTGLYDFTPYKGYADSWPNKSENAWLWLEDAVDPVTGNRATTPSSVKYIKVVTGLLLMNGPLGESSTEVSGIYKR